MHAALWWACPKSRTEPREKVVTSHSCDRSRRDVIQDIVWKSLKPNYTYISVPKIGEHFRDCLKTRNRGRPLTKKSGHCPLIEMTAGTPEVSTCKDQCGSDGDCPASMKCCDSGCGHFCVPTEGCLFFYIYAFATYVVRRGKIVKIGVRPFFCMSFDLLVTKCSDALKYEDFNHLSYCLNGSSDFPANARPTINAIVIIWKKCIGQEDSIKQITFLALVLYYSCFNRTLRSA